MNFTREPIIETVITPREGCKLVVRSSKGNGQEDYFVDAVEVVSFGHSFFFRSLKRPKSFIVPVSDYEILELKETRMVLKNVATERSIKIGGGRDAPRPREPMEERVHEEPQALQEGEQPAPPPVDRKRDKRRRGRRSGRDRQDQPPEHRMVPRTSEEGVQEGEEVHAKEPMAEEVKAPSFISKLFPPPPTLIRDTLSRYKTTESVGEDPFATPREEKAPSHFDESVFDEPIAPKHPEPTEDEEDRP